MCLTQILKLIGPWNPHFIFSNLINSIHTEAVLHFGENSIKSSGVALAWKLADRLAGPRSAESQKSTKDEHLGSGFLNVIHQLMMEKP